MTFSKRRCLSLVALVTLVLVVHPAIASLGRDSGAIVLEGQRMRALSVAVSRQLFTVHAFQMSDGSQIEQFVASNGKVFGITWNTLYKPDLYTLLGDSYPAYSSAARERIAKGGIQRQFHHAGFDFVIRSAGHLHVFRGYAYRPSMLPPGVTPESLGWS